MQPSSTQKSETISKEFIVMMAALMSIVAASIDAMLPALGIIRESFQLEHPNDSQLIVSAIFAGLAVGQLIFGPLSDAYGRRRILFFCLGIYFIGSFLCLFSSDFNEMLLGRVIQGLGAAGPNVSCLSIIRDKYHGRTMARIMSLVMMIFITVPIFAPALGQAIMLVTSWHAIFVFYIIYALSISIWVFIRLKETLPIEKRIPLTASNLKKDILFVLSNRQTMCYTFCMGLVFAALIGDLNSVQQIFQELFGMGEWFVVCFGLQALSLGAASFLNSRWVERFGMRHICLRALLVMMSISGILCFVQLIIPLPFWLFFGYGMVALFCIGLLFANLNSLALEPMGKIAGLASAVIGAVCNIIAIPLGTLIGRFYDGSLLPILAGFTLFSLGAVIFLIIAEPHNVSAVKPQKT